MPADRQDQSYNELQHTSTQLNQFILDHTHDLIAIHKLADLSYEYVNPATLKALGIDVALDEISRNSGILYGTDVVEACLRLFREERFNWN